MSTTEKPLEQCGSTVAGTDRTAASASGAGVPPSSEHGESPVVATVPESSDEAAISGGGRSVSVWLMVLGMGLMCLLPPFFQTARELAAGKGVAAVALLRTPPTRLALRAFEKRLEEASWLVEWARRTYTRPLDRWLQRGNARVAYGRDGWLFYRPALRYVAAPPFDREARSDSSLQRNTAPKSAPQGQPIDAIASFSDQLEEQGIGLLFVPVPTKATLYPEKLWPRLKLDTEASAPGNPAMAQLLQQLRSRGVEVLDPTAELLSAKERGVPVFLPRDTHWTPQGAALVAAQVRARLRALGWAQSEATNQFARRTVRFAGQGDLVGMFAYAQEQPPFDPMELLIEQVLPAAQQESVSPVVSSGAKLLLLGDSLTNVFSHPALEMGRRGGFAELLAASLGQPVEVIASAGGGANTVRRTLSLSPQRLQGKQAVVWEVTQRDLLLAEGGWQQIDLPAMSSARSVPSAEASNGPHAVRAEVLAVTPLPDLRDYADCLVVHRYRLVEGSVPSGEQELFVAHWGWRDWQPAESLDYRPGEVRELSLTPLAGHADLESTCWVEEVGMDRVPWWALSTSPHQGPGRDGHG